MTALEFLIFLVWLLLPPWVLASLGIVVIARRQAAKTTQAFMAILLLALFSAPLAFVFSVIGVPFLGRSMAVRDTPFFWAPFAFIAVGFAFPVVVIWLRRKNT